MSEDQCMFAGIAFGVAVVSVIWLLASGEDNRDRLKYAQTHYCVPIVQEQSK